MSDFSEKCRALLKENGYTVYHLSEVSGLDRTALQRTITGKRLPSPEFLSKLCSFLMLSKDEKEEVFLAYRIEKAGIEIIRQREIVKNVIEEMGACYQFSESQGAFPMAFEMIEKKEFPAVYFSDNHLEIQQLMMYVVFKELEECRHPVMCTNIPILYEQYFEQLLYLCLSREKKIKIHHIVEMNKNVSDIKQRFYNLEVLEKILPLAFNIWECYFPRYYYATIARRDEKKNLYPYYIITTQQVLQLAFDYQSVIVHQQVDYARYLNQQFMRVFNQCNLIVIENGSPGETFEKYIGLIGEYGMPTHSIEYEPCYLMMDPKCQRHPFISEYAELEKVYRIHFALEDVKESIKYKVNFSEKGLNEFVKTGRLTGYISQITRTFTVEDRKAMLDTLYVMAKEYDTTRIIADERFKILPNISMELFGKNCAILFNVVDDKSYSIVILKERLICNALYDFMESLEENNLILSREETLKRIKTYGKMLNG